MEQFFATIFAFFVEWMYAITFCLAVITFGLALVIGPGKNHLQAPSAELRAVWGGFLTFFSFFCMAAWLILWLFAYRVSSDEFAVYEENEQVVAVTKKGLGFNLKQIWFFSKTPIQVCDDSGKKYDFGLGPAKGCALYQVVPEGISKATLSNLNRINNFSDWDWNGESNSSILVRFVHQNRNDPDAPKLPFVKVVSVGK